MGQDKEKGKGQGQHDRFDEKHSSGFPRLCAQKIGKYAAKAGFDFPDAKRFREKSTRRPQRSPELIDGDDRDRLEEELGDLLFAVVNVCRKTGIDAEYALGRANEKFLRRFSHVEGRRCASGKKISDLEMETLLIRFGIGIRRRKR